MAQPPQIDDLRPLLSHLVLGDNNLRSTAEQTVDQLLASNPDAFLISLAELGGSPGGDETMQSFCWVLLRRLMFRSMGGTAGWAGEIETRATMYDRLSRATLERLEAIFLNSLHNPPPPQTLPKLHTCIAEYASQAMRRGRPWHALQQLLFTLIQSQNPHQRNTAYAIWALCPLLISDLEPSLVVGVLKQGLETPEIETRYEALKASVRYLEGVTSQDASTLGQATPLTNTMLDTLPTLASSLQATSGSPAKTNQVWLTLFLQEIVGLATSHPHYFAPHLQTLLGFIPPLILPLQVDAGPTPTGGKTLPRVSTVGGSTQKRDRSALRLAALEFMISLSESRPWSVKKVPGWSETLVRACLEGMAELDESKEAEEEWLNDDPSKSSNDVETNPQIYEQSLDRLACAVGGKEVLPGAFGLIPAMLSSPHWQNRHAGLSGIAAIAEGTGDVMVREGGKVVELVTPLFTDPHPRVRWAACQCVGQLCTDLEDFLQTAHAEQIIGALMRTARRPCPPCTFSCSCRPLLTSVKVSILKRCILTLTGLVERLLRLLSSETRYVQEQALTSLAMVADAAETAFMKHYSTLMPMLLNVLQNAEGSEYGRLRCKAMECAGLVAIAVGRDVFRADAGALTEALIRIQKSPPPTNDSSQLHSYLISTWGKVCQALGPEFEPYLPVVMPSLLVMASAKADVSVYDEDAADSSNPSPSGWETLSLSDGQALSIRTSAIEEKCQAFETLAIYCSTLGGRFAPYMGQTMEVVLPGLRFWWHEGVRESCALLVPLLLQSGKTSNTLTEPMLHATMSSLITSLTNETDLSFLASLYRSVTSSLRILGPALSSAYKDLLIEASKRQLSNIAERRKARAAALSAGGADEKNEEEREEWKLMEEVEDLVLEDMKALVEGFEPGHSLLVGISGVREVGMTGWFNEDD
ncbi:armadillo-type protein [Flagelloscypha sp. PMI_526]|nr:armadillo-type protein [Flagelloscypha sp. PMI_526]